MEGPVTDQAKAVGAARAEGMLHSVRLMLRDMLTRPDGLEGWKPLDATGLYPVAGHFYLEKENRRGGALGAMNYLGRLLGEPEVTEEEIAEEAALAVEGS